MSSITGSVPVLGKNDEILSYTNPARARILIDAGKARVIRRDPFVIKLVGTREEKMELSKSPTIVNFTEYFREERDVYVQNKSNTQVSMQFEVSPGRIESVLIPRDKKPLNLTQVVPFKAIKESMDLRKMVNRQPPVLVLLTEEQYRKYYSDIAAQMNTSPDAVIQTAQQYQRDLQEKRVFTEPELKGRKTLEDLSLERKDDPEDPQDKVTARVVGLCATAGEDTPERDRVSASDMLEELKDLDDGSALTRADLEYLQGHGVYKSVKNWANKIHGERWSS